MTVLVALKKARELVAKGWTQNAWARNKKGQECSLYAEDATCFCGDGAVRRVTLGTARSEGLYGKVRGLLDGAIGGLFPEFNDSHTKDDVLAAFNKAIEKVRRG